MNASSASTSVGPDAVVPIVPDATRRCRRGVSTARSHRCPRVWALADLLGEPDENALGASDVAEPIHVFVLDDFVDELRAVLAEPGQGFIEIVHGEHDAEVAEGVDRSGAVIGDRRRREKAREFDFAEAVWHTQHCDLDALVAQSSDAP